MFTLVIIIIVQEVNVRHWMKPFWCLACGSEALAHELRAAQYKTVELRWEANRVNEGFYCSRLLLLLLLLLLELYSQKLTDYTYN